MTQIIGGAYADVVHCITCSFTLIVYSMIRFEWTAAKFFWFLLFEVLSLVLFAFYGIVSVALTPNLVRHTLHCKADEPLCCFTSRARMLWVVLCASCVPSGCQ
jgi:hypothetical protein